MAANRPQSAAASSRCIFLRDPSFQHSAWCCELCSPTSGAWLSPDAHKHCSSYSFPAPLLCSSESLAADDGAQPLFQIRDSLVAPALGFPVISHMYGYLRAPGHSRERLADDVGAQPLLGVRERLLELGHILGQVQQRRAAARHNALLQ